jgi:hypothetical protein
MLTSDAVKRCIQSVVTELGWKYLADDDVGAEEVVSLFGSGELGNWVLISRILPDKRELLIMATAQENVPENARKHAVDFITRANFGILNGFFDMDLDDGDCRFASRVQYGFMDEEQFKVNFKKTFHIVHGTFSKYLSGIHAVIHRDFTGKAAVELVEGGAGIIPDANERPLLAAAAKHLSDARTTFVCHPQKGVIRMPCSVQGMTLQLRIKAVEESKSLYVFGSYPKNAGKVQKELISDELIEYITRVNWGLPFGYFDFDIDEGELKYVTWSNTDHLSLDFIQKKFVRTLIIACITTFVKYFPGLEDVISGVKSAKEAIAAAEGKKDDEKERSSQGHTLVARISSNSDALVGPPSSARIGGRSDRNKSLRGTRQRVVTSMRRSLPFISLSSMSPFLSLMFLLFPLENRVSLPPPSVESNERAPGIIAYLAKSISKAKEWKNPVDSGLMSIKSSPALLTRSMKIEGLLEESPTGSYVSTEIPDPYILLEFRNLFNPTHYLLEFMDVGVGGPPKSWMIQCSLDNSTWDTLRVHEMDESLKVPSKKSAHCIFRLACSPKALYRFMRITQVQENWKGTSHLVIRAIEVFGQLCLDSPTETEVADEKHKEEKSDLLPPPTFDIIKSMSDVLFSDPWEKVGMDSLGDIFKANFCGVDVMVRSISWKGVPLSLKEEFEAAVSHCR